MRNRKLIRVLLPVITGLILAIAAALNFNSGVLASQDHDECGESSGWNHSSHYRDDDDCEDDDEEKDEDDRDDENDDDDKNDEHEDNDDEEDGEDDQDENGDSNGGTNQDQGQSQEQKQKTEVNVNVEQKQENNQTVNVTGQVAGVSTVPVKQPETGPGVLGMASVAGAGPLGLLLARYGKGRIAGKKEEDLTSIASDIVTDRLSKKSS